MKNLEKTEKHADRYNAPISILLQKKFDLFTVSRDKKSIKGVI